MKLKLVIIGGGASGEGGREKGEGGKARKVGRPGRGKVYINFLYS